jgi:flagellar biosynthesis GTPase FlhF
MTGAHKTGNAAALSMLFFAIFVAGCVSSSRPRVAVVVDGKLSAPVVEAVDDALARDYVVLPEREYRTTAESLKAQSMSPKDVRQVAEELGLSSVVYATVRGKKVQLQLRDGGTGKPVWRFSARLRKKELLAKDRRVLEKRLLSHASAVEAKNQKRRERITKKERREQEKREKEEEKLRAAQEKKDAREQAKREKEEEKLRAAQEKKDAREQAKREKEEEKAREAEEREAEKRAIEEMQIKVDEKGQAIDDESP